MNLQSLKILICVGVTLLLSSCASQKANVDYLPGTDFSAYQSFTWIPAPADPTKSQRAKNPMNDKRIVDAINQTLASKGITQQEGKADLLVNYHVSVSEHEQQSRGRVSVGSSRYSGGSSMGFAVSVPVGGNRTHKEGTLVVDLVDGKTNELIWQGAASRTVRDDMSPEKTSALINEVVREILDNFPPKTK